MPTLFDQLDAEAAGGSRVAEQFARWHALHPEVYELFKRYAAEVRAAGFSRYSARDILARLRWHVQVEKRGEYRINNIASPFYARMLVAEDPSYAGFFEMRAAAADAEEVSE